MRSFSSYISVLLLMILSACSAGKKTVKKNGPADTSALLEIYYSAELQYNTGNNKEADSLFRLYLRKSGNSLNSAPAFYRLACIARDQNRDTAAQNWINKARKTDTANKYYKLFDASLAINQRNYAKTADIYASILTVDKRAWSLYADAVKFYQYSGQWQKSIHLCNIWEKNFSLMEPIAENRSLAYLRLGNKNAAAMEWEKLSKKYPDRRQYKITLASRLADCGNIGRWRSITDSLLAENPNDASLLSTLCRDVSDRLNAEEQLRYAEKLAEINAEFQTKWGCVTTIGNPSFPLYAKTGVFYEKMFAMHPTETSLLISYSDFLSYKKEHQKAADVYAKAFGQFNPGLDHLKKYFYLLQCIGDKDGMLRTADSIFDMYPNNAAGYIYKSFALLEKKDFIQASSVIQSAAAFAFEEKELIDIKIVKYRILIGEGKSAAALAEWKNLYQSYPNSPAVMHLGADLNMENSPEQALTLINKAIQADTNNGWYVQSRIWIKKKLRLNPENDISILAKLLPDNAQAQEMAGDLYIEYKEHTPEALQCWKKALTCKNANVQKLRQKIQDAERL